MDSILISMRGYQQNFCSQGNIYTTETYEGKRLQKFVYTGMGPVTMENQGVVWPRSSR